MDIYTSANGAKWLVFEEYIFINYKKEKGKQFDVSAKGFRRIPSDLMLNGEFSQEYYCTCLIETVVRLPPNQLSKFLDYQCKQFKKPEQWLNNLDMLAQINKHTDLMREYYEEFNLITALVSKKLASLSGQIEREKGNRVSEPLAPYNIDPRFQIEKVKEELELIPTIKKRKYFLLRRMIDFTQLANIEQDTGFNTALQLELQFMEDHKELVEQEIADMAKKNGKKPKDKRTLFRESPKLLADLFRRLLLLRNKKGELLFEGDIVDLIEMISLYFCGIGKKSYSQNSLRTYIRDNHLDLKGKGWKVDITFIEDEAKSGSNK